MKRTLAIILAVFVAAFTISSCSKDDDKKPTSGTASYDFGMVKGEGDGETLGKIFSIFKTELNSALPGAKYDTGVYTLQNVNFKDTDAKVLNACKEAERRISSEVTIEKGDTFTIRVAASHEGEGFNEKLYYHTFE